MIPQNLALLLPDWDSLDSVRKAHSCLELWAIWLFAALVVCDVVAHLIEDTRKPLAKIFERIGLCCFALAVIAELAAYKYGQRNDDLSAGVIISLDTKSKEALNKASDAYDLAQSASGIAAPAKRTANEAKEKADAVAVQSDALSGRITEEMGRLNDVSPRAVVLASDSSNVVEKLWPFSGQLVNLEICGDLNLNGPDDRRMDEELDTEEVLFNILIQRANWKQHRGALFWHFCTSGLERTGIFVFVSSVNAKADSQTFRAAQALSGEIGRLLPIRQGMPVCVLTDDTLNGEQPDEQSPWQMAGKETGLIAVLISQQPVPTTKRNIPAQATNCH